MTVDRFAQYDAAYALGALSDSERAQFEAHMESCALCRMRVADARELLAVLGTTTESDLDPGPGRRTQPGRSWRRAAIGISAAAATIALVTGLAVLSNHSAQVSGGRPMSPVSDSPVRATASLTRTSWGTEIQVRCWYTKGGLPSGYTYALSVKGSSDQTYPVGTWKLGSGDPITFTTGTSLAPDQIREVDLTDSDGTRLLTLTN